MATRKVGSRRLVVDGTAYRWRIRRRATNLQADYGSGRVNLAVELADQPGCVLVVLTNHLHPANYATKPQGVVPVRPSDVAAWVRQALKAGWAPAQSGPQFLFLVTGHPPVSGPICPGKLQEDA